MDDNVFDDLFEGTIPIISWRVFADGTAVYSTGNGDWTTYRGVILFNIDRTEYQIPNFTYGGVTISYYGGVYHPMIEHPYVNMEPEE